MLFFLWKSARPFPERAWEEFFPEDLNAFVAVELGPEKTALVRASAVYSILADPDVLAYAREAGSPLEPSLRALDGIDAAALGVRRERTFFAARGRPDGMDAVVADALAARGGAGEVSDYGHEEFRGRRGKDFCFLEVLSRDKLILGGSGRGEAEELLDCFLAPPERVLKDSKLFGKAFSLVGSGGVVSGFVDARLLVDDALDRTQLAAGRTFARESVGALGLDRLGCVAFSSTFDGDASCDVVAVAFDERAGLLDALTQSDLALLAETYVPRSATAWAALSVDPASALTAVKAGLPRGRTAAFQMWMGAVSIALGVDIGKELLPALGSEFAVFLLPGLAMGREKNVGLIVRLKDPKKVEAALEKGASAAKILTSGLKVDVIEYRGVRIRYFEREGRKTVPAVAITDDALLFGFSDTVVRRMLHAREQGRGATLASREELRPMLEKATSAVAVWCVSWDQLMGELLGLAGFWLDAKKATFPVDAVVEKLFTGWGVVTMEEAHLRIESRSPVGISALFLLGPSASEPPAEEGEVF